MWARILSLLDMCACATVCLLFKFKCRHSVCINMYMRRTDTRTHHLVVYLFLWCLLSWVYVRTSYGVDGNDGSLSTRRRLFSRNVAGQLERHSVVYCLCAPSRKSSIDRTRANQNIKTIPCTPRTFITILLTCHIVLLSL